MKLTSLSLMGLCFFVLTACGADHSPYQKSTTGIVVADAAGNCTRDVVNDYNGIIEESGAYSRTNSFDDLTQLKKYCIDFKTEMGTSSCYSVNSSTKRTEDTSYSGSLRDTCEEVLSQNGFSNNQ